MVSAFIEKIHSYRKVLFVLWCLLSVAMALSIKPLRISGTSEELWVKNDPSYLALSTMYSLFPRQPNMVVKVTPDSVSLEGIQSAIAHFSNDLKASVPKAEVHDITSGLKELKFEGATPIHEILALFKGLPTVKNFVSHDTSSFLIPISVPRMSGDQLNELNEVVHASYQGIKSLKSFSQAQLEAEVENLLIKDIIVLPSILLLIFMIYIFYVYRSWQSIVVCVVPILASLLLTIACFSVFGAEINLITLLVIPIVIVLSIADAIHLLTGFYAQEGVVKTESILYTLKIFFVPSLLTSLTTAIAFYSLSFNQSENIRSLGIISGTGILGSFLITYLTVPLLLYLLPQRRIKRRFIYRLSGHFTKNKKVYSAFIVLLFILSFFFMSQVRFKSDFNTFFPKHSEQTRNHHEIDREFFSQLKLNLLISPEKNETSAEFDLNGTVEEVVRSLRDFKGIADITYIPLNYADIFPLAKQHEELWENLKLKDRFISRDGRTQLIEIRFRSANDIKEFEQQFLEHFKDGIPGCTYALASDALLIEAIDKQTASDLLDSLLASGLLIIIIILLLTRSFLKTVYSLFANLAPLAAIVLILALFDLTINVLTSITAVVCLGLIVDDTIHVLYRREVLKKELQELGFGMLSTSLLLTLGFLTLNFSHFIPTQTFGNMSSAIFIITLISDLTLLPLLLDSIGKRGIRRSSTGPE